MTRLIKKMIRPFVLLLAVFYGLAYCDDVDIADEESQPSTNETNENEFAGAPEMSAILAFTDPPFGLRETAGLISLVAGKQASIVISLENQHPTDTFSLYSMEAALHYPRYYGYHIQNFTVQRQHNILEPKQQASLAYSFTPSVQLAGQRFDLAVILTYFHKTGKPYLHAIFNDTISILEDEEAADVEMIFLGLMVAVVTLVVAFGIWHWNSRKAVKRSPKGNSNAHSNGENKYIALTKKTVTSTKSERVDGTVKRRQGKK